mgnify:CR=1 FL=1
MIKKLKITSNLKIRIWGTFFYYKILINRNIVNYNVFYILKQPTYTKNFPIIILVSIGCYL